MSLEGPAENIGADMAEAAIFVLSSRFEGFPLILLEAMSKGMSVVSFDCPTGPSDIIDDHRNGILVPAEDIDALARGIDEMITDEALRRRTAAAAVETSQQYTMEAVGPQWTALFAELSRTRRPAPGCTLRDSRDVDWIVRARPPLDVCLRTLGALDGVVLQHAW